ncbi:receptor-like protein 9a [Quercus suber]|uniref:Receptor-like protein 9a n=1 Tax=Quercus suber TaxID=58331 RepID=A0AAW0JRL7_QUESU
MKCLTWGLIVQIQIRGHRGCFEEERTGLLEIKEFVRSNGNDVDHLLHSWANDPKSECYDWEQVICDSNTGHVVELFLHNVKELSYVYSPRFKYYFLRNDRDNYMHYLETNHSMWFLNVSLFEAFNELKSLNLSMNEFEGWIGNEGSESLCRLKRLEILDLGYNEFNRSIIQSLSLVTSLKNLILHRNQLKGSFLMKELSILEDLEMLDLSYNLLNGSLTMQDFESFDSLEILDLSWNGFTRNLPHSIRALSSLKSLSLSSNYLNGSSPTQGKYFIKILCKDNHFKGNISSLIVGLTSLKHTDLSYNLFEGLFSFDTFANHSKLELVQIICDSKTLDIETEIQHGYLCFSRSSLCYIIVL